MKNKGITLIALVITIVVLIILAAVAINLSLGNNGIFNRAKTGKELYQNAEEYERTEVGKSTNQIDSYISGNRDNTSYNYSLDEQVVGTWIDGKPLYQKTIKTKTPSSTGASNIADLPANYDNIYIASAFFIEPGSVLTLAYSSNSNECIWIRTASNTYGPNKITMQVATTNFLNRTIYITIHYTKTTDAATRVIE